MAKITGTELNDALTGTAGDDLMYGGNGDDTLTADQGGNDKLYGGAGNDTLIGGAGNDFLEGGLGADVMRGGLGDDVYEVQDANDRVIELAGEGNDSVMSYLVEYRLTANVENLYMMLNGAQNAKGNELGNRIRGNDFTNKISTYGGDDVVGGFGGDDFINPGTGRDQVDGGAGIDTITYRVDATHGVTVDLNFNNFLGSPGVVYTYEDGTQDTLFVRNVENVEGTFFDDRLIGDAGANKLVALAGNDFLRGGAGNDQMTGGEGNDTFHFERAGAANGQDQVSDYQIGDTLEFLVSDGYAANAGFTVGRAAVGAGPQFVYLNNRELYYDADGAGGAAMIKIATINGDILTRAGINIVDDTGTIPL